MSKITDNTVFLRDEETEEPLDEPVQVANGRADAPSSHLWVGDQFAEPLETAYAIASADDAATAHLRKLTDDRTVENAAVDVYGTGSSSTTAAAPTITYEKPIEKASAGAVYYHNPQAEYVASEDKTFFVYRGVGADPEATAYDHSTGTFDSRAWVGSNPLSDTDGHSVPGMAIESDGTIHTLFGAHNTDFEYARTDNGYDVGSWTSTTTLTGVPGGTYPSMVVDDSDTIWVLYRTSSGADGSYPGHEFATIIKSTDGGSTWTDIGPVIDTTGHPDSHTDAYVSDMDLHDGVLHFTWVVAHGSSHDGTRDDVHHAWYDPSDGNCYAYDGTNLGSKITWSEHSTCQVYSGQARGAYHAFDGSTWHIMARTVNSNGDEEPVLLTWRGSSWKEYSTGATADSSTRHVNGFRLNSNNNPEAHIVTGTGTYERYIRKNGSWDSETVIDSATDSIKRVACPRAADDALAAFATVDVSNDTFNTPLYAAGSLGDYNKPAPTTVDDFNDGDASEYSATTFTSGSHSVQQSTTIEGTHTLQISPDDNYALQSDGNSLPTINIGDNIRYNVRQGNDVSNTQQVNFAILESGTYYSDGNGYRFVIDDAGGNTEIKIQRHENGSSTTLDNATASTTHIKEDLTVDILTGTDQRIAMRLFDSNGDLVKSIAAYDQSASYSTFDYVVFQSYTSSTSSLDTYYDNLRILPW